MYLFCTNTVRGLIPCYDSDYEEKRKLRIGETYRCNITLAKGIAFHRKYFALINCAWAYQNERTVEHFKTVDSFRKTVEIAAGHCDTIYSIARKEWIEVPKSIAFDKTDELEFRELYERVKDVLFGVFLKNISEEEFMKNLVNF